MTLKISLNHSSGSINIIRIDKDVFNKTKNINVISQTIGNIETMSGYILENGNVNTTGNPYIFDIENFDYAINLTNLDENNILTCELEGFSNTQKEVYIVGIDDSNGFVNQKILYQELTEDNGNYVLLED